MTNKISLALVAVLICGGAAPAFAGKRHRHHHHHHGHHRHYHHRPHVHFYSTPAPYYYAPPTVIYTQRPVYVEEPVYVEAPVRGRLVEENVEASVQAALGKRGYYRGTIDGQIGPQTRASIRAYQVDKGLPVTGRIDSRLLRSLRLL